MAEDEEEEEEVEYDEGDDDCEQSDDSGNYPLANIHIAYRNQPFTVIPLESLLAEQNEIMRTVIDLFGVKEQHARTLLIFYRWNIDTICDLLERRGRERLLEEAGVPVVASAREKSASASGAASSSSVTCNVCFDDVSPDAASEMDCGHCFCNDCWSQHFIIRINDGESRAIRCMATECRAICDEAVVRRLLRGKDAAAAAAAERFDRWLIESYVEENDHVKWCPSAPHCGSAVRVEDAAVPLEVACSCGLEFCFSCLSEPHSPVTCAMQRLWVKRCEADSESATWIKDHVKACPKCHKLIEKNGGCNLVTCLCGQHFCWICGCATGYSHTMTEIANHRCNKYKEEANIMKARRGISRFTHYYTRNKAHSESLATEKDLLSTVRAKLSAEEEDDEVEGFGMQNWMLDGFRTLLASRRILPHTCTLAFYMFGDELFQGEMTEKEREVKMNLFEDHQQQLQANVERLSGALSELLEDLAEDGKLVELRQRVRNLSAVVNNFCKQMYAFIEGDLLGDLKSGVHHIADFNAMTLNVD